MWIRGSAERTLNHLHQSCSKTYGCGNKYSHSVEKWRLLIRQAWLKGLLNRSLTVGGGNNMISSITFATYSLSDTGINYLEKDSCDSILLPDIQSNTKASFEQDTKSVESVISKQRIGKGCHALTVFQKLISDKKNWFPITNSEGYNFPGVFYAPYPQRLGYCEDITKLINYEKTDPHFIFSDIQLGKGKARPKRLITMDINGKMETVFYRFVPCGGVKLCGMHTEGCSYVAPTSAVKPCHHHPGTPLQRTTECPVVFFYVWPEDLNDNRRWLTGLVRSGELETDNLHNHPLHNETKIPVKVDSDIRRAIVENPHLKTSDLITGICAFIHSFIHY